jgi:hypothetical protein
MKRTLILALTALILLPAIAEAAQTAQARMHCLSLRVHRGSATDSGGFRWTMDMTTLAAGINGELSPDFFNSGYTNSTYVELFDELGDEYFEGALVVDLPDVGDANGNGIFDFFEVSQGISSTSLGYYDINFIGQGGFTATWLREAGSAVGHCVIPIRDPYNPSRQLTFLHAFEILEYTGPLTYTPGTNIVNASVDFTLTGDPLNSLKGPVTFQKSSTNRFNRLTLTSALMTNAVEQVLDLYTPTTFLRGTTFPTNYQGLVEFNDGDLNTLDDDYFTWMLSINDANDSDGDGIPDFSDDPQSALPRAPLLSLSRTATNLVLRISGDVGRVHQIQEASSVTATEWPTVMSVTLTNDPQFVSLPLPAGLATFWRVRAQ